MKPIKVALIAGETSGDTLGAELVFALRTQLKETQNRDVEIVGVGGEGLQAEGLTSFFDFSELSIVGLGAVLAKLPKLLWRIRQTAAKIIASKPDILVIIDSPDFTHRVAKIVRQKQPNIPIINYVCPSVWAWKPERAQIMRDYIDHVLAVLPFEPEIVAHLNGPPLTYIGHRLIKDVGANTARDLQLLRKKSDQKTFLLLPGSRTGEINRHIDLIKQTAIETAKQFPNARFIMPTISKFKTRLDQETSTWGLPVEVVAGNEQKWRAFGQSDAAIAASGTILLELALARVPCLSIYRPDFLFAKLMVHKITIWTAALPNLIVGYPAVSEHFDATTKPLALAKRLGRLATDTLEREAQLMAFDDVHDKMQVEQAPSENAAKIVIDYLKT
jgi:lipid-A-disaccharide synthase